MLYYLKLHCKQELCGEDYEQPLFFSLFKKLNLNNKKKIINICYLIMVLIKKRLLGFLVLSLYGLNCKYGIVFEASIYNWTQNCIF